MAPNDPHTPTDGAPADPQVSAQDPYRSTQDFRDSGMMGGAGQGDAGAQDTGHLVPGNLVPDEPQTGDTRTMTTPGSSLTDDGASQGHRIAGDDNRQ